MTKIDALVKENPTLHPGIGEHIGFELGAKLVKDYYDAYGENTCHFIGKNILEKILNQPNCIGVNIYKALNEAGDGQTYVLVGVDTNGKSILDYTAINTNGELSTMEGVVGERVGVNSGWWDLF
jgi:hypothetical protein